MKNFHSIVSPLLFQKSMPAAKLLKKPASIPPLLYASVVAKRPWKILMRQFASFLGNPFFVMVEEKSGG